MEINDLVTIINREELTDFEKDTYKRMIDKFVDALPDSLYQDPYTLQHDTGFSANLWKKLFRIPAINRTIELEIASLIEYGSRQAIRKLADGTVHSQEVGAIKELLSRSKMMQEGNKSKTILIFSYIPPKEEKQ